VYGSKKDTQHFENIVIDYQSAVAIENDEPSVSEVPISPKFVAGDQKRPVSAPNNPTEGKLFSSFSKSQVGGKALV
jgi:hypothetical protein